MSNWQYTSITWDNGLAPNRRQAIIWTNADPVHRECRINAALGGDELINVRHKSLFNIKVRHTRLLLLFVDGDRFTAIWFDLIHQCHRFDTSRDRTTWGRHQMETCRLSIGLKSGDSIPNLTRNDPDINPTGFTVSSATMSVADSWPIHWKFCGFCRFRIGLAGVTGALLALYAGNSPVTSEFPSQSQRRGALMFSLICDLINDWVNNPDAGDLRRHRAHYDAAVMIRRFMGYWNRTLGAIKHHKRVSS